MPIYSFVCPACGFKEERLVRKMDEAFVCPECHKENLKVVWSVPAVAQWKCSRGSL